MSQILVLRERKIDSYEISEIIAYGCTGCMDAPGGLLTAGGGGSGG